MKKVKATKMLIVLLIVFGAAISLYPSLSNRLAEYRSVQEIGIYEKEVSNLPQKVRDTEWGKAIVYNNMLKEHAAGGMFIRGSGTALPTNYSNVLNISGTGMMGILEIPDIKVKLPIYHGVGEEELKKGVGHIEGTSLPIGGRGEHSFLTSHTGLPSARLFSDLNKLTVDDIFCIHIMEKTLVYQVENISVVSADETFVFDPDDNRDLVTLITCTPYGVNSHRLLVQGFRIYPANDLPEVQAEQDTHPLLWRIFAWFVLAILIALLYKLSRFLWKISRT